MDIEERGSLPFVGGIKQYGYQCGQIWGVSLGAGARVYQKIGDGAEAESRTLHASQKLVSVFRSISGEVNCHEITSLDKDSTNMDMVKYFLLKGGSIGCFRMASKYAPMAYDVIEESLKADVQASQNPISCTALLAKKSGAQAKHQTMVAGLAGGIGFSGEACGALGTAVWLKAMKLLKDLPDLDLWSDKEFGQWFESTVEKFLAASDYEFECADIVGRKFKDVDDHSHHLREGGCSKIIDALKERLD
jgi:hypothetical protein